MKNRIKLLFNFISFIFIYFISQKEKKLEKKKEIIFDIKDFYNQRLYSFLILAFAKNDYQVYIYFRVKSLADLVEHGDRIAKLKNVKLIFSLDSASSSTIYFYDYDSPHVNYFKNIRINTNFEIDKLERYGNLLLPFYMSPKILFDGMHKDVYSLRKKKRSMKIVFSGNANPDSYDNPIYKSYWKMMSRIEILNFLKKNLDESQLLLTNDLLGLEEKNYTNKCVISEWSRKSEKEKIILGRVPTNLWLQTLASSDFILACPGIVQPLCHNLIEAMSVGTIPIMQHNRLMNPALIDGVNAIVFNNPNELKEKIKYCLNMSNDEIKIMRTNVINYYEEYLSLHAITKFIDNNSTNTHKTIAITTGQFIK